MVTLNAHFDGKVIVPDEPLSLAPNQKIRISIEPLEHESAQPSIKRTFLAQPDAITDVAADFDAHLGDDFWGIENGKTTK